MPFWRIEWFSWKNTVAESAETRRTNDRFVLLSFFMLDYHWYIRILYFIILLNLKCTNHIILQRIIKDLKVKALIIKTRYKQNLWNNMPDQIHFLVIQGNWTIYMLIFVKRSLLLNNFLNEWKAIQQLSKLINFNKLKKNLLLESKNHHLYIIKFIYLITDSF